MDMHTLLQNVPSKLKVKHGTIIIHVSGIT